MSAKTPPLVLSYLKNYIASVSHLNKTLMFINNKLLGERIDNYKKRLGQNRIIRMV